MFWTYVRHPPLNVPPQEPPAQGSLGPYRAPPPLIDERAAPDDDEASTRRVVVVATLFALLCSLLRLKDPLFGNEEFGLDPWLALIAAEVSGVYLVKVVVAWSRRRLGLSWKISRSGIAPLLVRPERR